MLSCSSATTQALSSSNRIFKYKCQVTRNDSGATPVDISDRILSSQITSSFDSRNSSAQLTLDNYDFLLSPLNRNSSMNLVNSVYDPLLDSNHKIQLWEGVQASDGSIEYILKFTGYLGDEIDASASNSSISVTVRDGSKLLSDKYIYQSKSYSLWVVEDVIQDLINMFAPECNITLNVQQATYYAIGRADNPYTAQNVDLWTAIQTLADGSSQELRFMEDGSLIMRPVVIDFWGMTPNYTLDESSLASDDQQIQDTDVRNAIVVKIDGYPYASANCQDSINKYGFRYMEVDQSLSDLYTDASQAYTLANNILMDLAYPKPIETSVVPLNPLYQVGDIVAINSPRIGINSQDDIWFVTSIVDSFSPNNKRTTITLKGYNKFDNTKPAPPNPPTNVTVTTLARQIQNYPNSGWNGYEQVINYPLVKWNPPVADTSGNALSPDFGGYVISRGGTTIASIPSYISSLNLNVDYFYDYSFSGGTVTYSVEALDKYGQKSTSVSSVSTTIPSVVFKDISGNII